MNVNFSVTTANELLEAQRVKEESDLLHERVLATGQCEPTCDAFLIAGCSLCYHLWNVPEGRA